jgi:hypothetical protein
VRSLLIALIVLVVACGGDLPADPANLTAAPPALVSLTIVKVDLGRQVAQFDVALRREDGALVQRKLTLSNASSVQQVDLLVDESADYHVVLVFKDRSGKAVGVGHQRVTVTRGSTSRVTFSHLQKPESLSVTPPISQAEVGGRTTFKARATLPGGDEVDVSHGVDWESSEPNVARVNELGEAQALAAGSALILARFGALEAQAVLTIGQGFVSVPTLDYGHKTGIHIRVGGGKRVFTELDTGSGALVVGQSHIGPDVTMTDTNVTITYAHGTNPRPGKLGYARVELLNSEDTVLSTVAMIPILVVEDDVVSGGGRNDAIFGLRLNSSVTPRIFFPEPYNQGFVLNRPGHEIRFGSFNPTDFATVQLPPTQSDDSGLTGGTPPASTLFWDDAAVPITYQFSGGPAPALWNSLLDTGASSSVQSLPFPSYLIRNDASVLQNTITASMATTQGEKTIFLTEKVHGYAVDVNGQIVNVGNEMPKHYLLYFDQVFGLLGLGELP